MMTDNPILIIAPPEPTSGTVVSWIQLMIDLLKPHTEIGIAVGSKRRWLRSLQGVSERTPRSAHSTRPGVEIFDYLSIDRDARWLTADRLFILCEKPRLSSLEHLLRDAPAPVWIMQSAELGSTLTHRDHGSSETLFDALEDHKTSKLLSRAQVGALQDGIRRNRVSRYLSGLLASATDFDPNSKIVSYETLELRSWLAALLAHIEPSPLGDERRRITVLHCSHESLNAVSPIDTLGTDYEITHTVEGALPPTCVARDCDILVDLVSPLRADPTAYAVTAWSLGRTVVARPGLWARFASGPLVPIPATGKPQAVGVEIAKWALSNSGAAPKPTVPSHIRFPSEWKASPIPLRQEQSARDRWERAQKAQTELGDDIAVECSSSSSPNGTIAVVGIAPPQAWLPDGLRGPMIRIATLANLLELMELTALSAPLALARMGYSARVIETPMIDLQLQQDLAEELGVRLVGWADFEATLNDAPTRCSSLRGINTAPNIAPIDNQWLEVTLPKALFESDPGQLHSICDGGVIWRNSDDKSLGLILSSGRKAARLNIKHTWKIPGIEIRSLKPGQDRLNTAPEIVFGDDDGYVEMEVRVVSDTNLVGFSSLWPLRRRLLQGKMAFMLIPGAEVDKEHQ